MFYAFNGRPTRNHANIWHHATTRSKTRLRQYRFGRRPVARMSARCWHSRAPRGRARARSQPDVAQTRWYNATPPYRFESAGRTLWSPRRALSQLADTAPTGAARDGSTIYTYSSGSARGRSHFHTFVLGVHTFGALACGKRHTFPMVAFLHF